MSDRSVYAAVLLFLRIECVVCVGRVEYLDVPSVCIDPFNDRKARAMPPVELRCKWV